MAGYTDDSMDTHECDHMAKLNVLEHLIIADWKKMAIACMLSHLWFGCMVEGHMTLSH